MAQHDKELIDDSQNASWLNGGTLQGLQLNGVNQYLTFTADATFRSLINQNQALTFEVNNKGLFAIHNRINLLSGKLLFYQTNISEISTLSFLNAVIGDDRRTGVAPFIVNYIPARAKLVQAIITYDGGRNSLTSFKTAINGRNIPNNRASGNPDMLITDNVYTDSSIFRIGTNPITLAYIAGIFSNLRIYTNQIANNKFIEKYHNIPNNDLVVFCEWKCEQPSDFYIFGGNLYAKNTGTSGNGFNNGTGYDMQVIGYIGNVPTFNTLL
jgi:hypothetical protein